MPDAGGGHSSLAWIELLLVLAFAIGWFVLEQVAKRYDRKPEHAKPTDGDASEPPSKPKL